MNEKDLHQLEQQIRDARPTSDPNFQHHLEEELLEKLHERKINMLVKSNGSLNTYALPAPPISHRRQWLTLAAALLVVLFAGAIFYSNTNRPDETGGIISAPLQDVVTTTPTLTIIMPSATFTATPTFTPTPAQFVPELVFFPEFQRDLPSDSTFLLYDQRGNRLLTYNPDQATTRYPPFSTFQILNTSIALETGVISDTETIISYNPEQYPQTDWDNLPSSNNTPSTRMWAQDHNIRTGTEYSVAWFFTELANRIGQETMQEYISNVEYGNMDISVWFDDIPFWDSSLEISAMEQLHFLRGFYNEELGFSQETTDAVKGIMLLEDTETYRLYSTTGSIYYFGGWIIGFIEFDREFNEPEVYFFALNMVADLNLIDITHRILAEIGILPN